MFATAFGMLVSMRTLLISQPVRHHMGITVGDKCHLGYPRHQKFSNQKWSGGGLSSIDVAADGYIAVGCGETYDDAVQDHHRNLTAFLGRCHEQNVRVNPEKMKL